MEANLETTLSVAKHAVPTVLLLVLLWMAGSMSSNMNRQFAEAREERNQIRIEAREERNRIRIEAREERNQIRAEASAERGQLRKDISDLKERTARVETSVGSLGTRIDRLDL